MEHECQTPAGLRGICGEFAKGTTKLPGTIHQISDMDAGYHCNHGLYWESSVFFTADLYILIKVVKAMMDGWMNGCINDGWMNGG